MVSNQTQLCPDINEFVETSSKCFEDFISPNVTDCDLLLLIHRLVLIDCYFRRLFFPLTGSLVLLGTVLNLFSLYCFLKMNKRNSQNVYLSVLSLGDTINLHINFTIPLLRQSDSIDDYFYGSPILCRFNGFFAEFFLIFPTWIIVLLTVERLICVLSPLKCHSLFTQRRAKVSILVLALVVSILCLYRFYDLKGIDQANAFMIVACEDKASFQLRIIQTFNLIIWTILPECLTLMMNLIIIYNIKLATQRFEPFYSKARQSKYNQATKTVLLISILSLVFHTPTGIIIGLDLLYTNKERTIGLMIILVSKKLTYLLYEISLCCKFFIYIRTFRNFKSILHLSMARFTRRTNSAKLGRPILDINHSRPSQNKSFRSCHDQRTFQFERVKTRQRTHANELGAIPQHHPLPRNSIKTSTSTSRASRDQHHHHHQVSKPVLMIKATDSIQLSVPETPNLLRRCTTGTRISLNSRMLWRSKPQVTL